jgi:hypothetical protein
VYFFHESKSLVLVLPTPLGGVPASLAQLACPFGQVEQARETQAMRAVNEFISADVVCKIENAIYWQRTKFIPSVVELYGAGTVVDTVSSL